MPISSFHVRSQIRWNPVSYITVSWIYPLLQLGNKKPLVETDLPILNEKEQAVHSSQWLDCFMQEASEYSKSWTVERESTSKPPSLLRALLPHIIGVLVFNGFCQAILVALNLTMSLMVGEITNYLDPTYPRSNLLFDNGIGLAFLLFGMQLAATLATNISASLTTVTNIRMSAAITSAVYKKSLKLAAKSRVQFPAGKINTFCSADVANLNQFINVVNQIWTMPIQLVVALYLVSTLMKASTTVAAGVFIGIGSLSALVTPHFGKNMKAYMKGQDRRTFVLREFLYGVKSVKYQALEETIDNKFQAERLEQVKSLRAFYFYFCIFLSITAAQQYLTTPLTIIAYSALGNDMKPATVFVAYSLLNGLAQISGHLSSILNGFIASITSYKRLQEFLVAEEVDFNDGPMFLTVESGQDALAIALESAFFSWENTNNHSQPAAAQKEVKNSKKLSTNDVGIAMSKMSTCIDQELDSDIFKLSDQNLSIKKGSLVAVVGATGSGKSSFLSAITGGMRKIGGKATVYGTIGYCAQEPWIISGTVEDNITLLDTNLNDSCSSAIRACSLEKDLKTLPHGLGTQIGEKGINLSGGQKSRIALGIFGQTVIPGKFTHFFFQARSIAKNPDIFVLDDPLSSLDAHVSNEIFKNTISGPVMKGKTVVIATHLLHILPNVDQVIVMEKGRIVQNGSFAELMKDNTGRLFKTMKDYHLDEKTDKEDERFYEKLSKEIVEIKKEEAIVEDRQVVIGVSALLIFACVDAGTHFHDNAWHGLLQAQLSWFDSQPIGRILNRMTTDVKTISIFLLCLAVSMFLFYRKTYRELKRLNAIMQSPLSAHVSETLSGLSTILAFSAQPIFIAKHLAKLDQANLGTMLFSHVQYWFMLRLDSVGAFVSLALALLGVTGVMDRSFVALALAATMQWSTYLSYLLTAFAEVEAGMVSVERLNHYSHELPHEASRHTPKDTTLSAWPSAGNINVKNLELIYNSRPDTAVIKDLTVKIFAGEKIGIVGRTGSGKSTFVDSLFRLLEASNGTIEIDGVDITTVGLKKLRESVQMIPQNPILFDGTVRSNIDYSSKHTDDEIWYSLESCGMKEYVAELSEKLDSKITEGGSNLSAGQRQLICLAKVMLDKAKILVMDEATSSVDAESDLRIQQLMKTHFKDATVISIAHRLNTIAAFDRVLVLNNGIIAEFDAPHILLSRPESIFGEMVNSTGFSNAAVIREIANNHYHKKLKATD
ncbi:Multidrug resistance-associated protein 1 [Physocladia obscura]|uniref:Multidrug resistance-associated protein 1 n=1 Tax=Physocladia obscura TaxID=109957 RepID=A0AAD5SX70_9FUNG|nr:Multidrug resistance-associated protein 1 [Physocladia obscura]